MARQIAVFVLASILLSVCAAENRKLLDGGAGKLQVTMGKHAMAV